MNETAPTPRSTGKEALTAACPNHKETEVKATENDVWSRGSDAEQRLSRVDRVDKPRPSPFHTAALPLPPRSGVVRVNQPISFCVNAGQSTSRVSPPTKAAPYLVPFSTYIKGDLQHSAAHNGSAFGPNEGHGVDAECCCCSVPLDNLSCGFGPRPTQLDLNTASAPGAGCTQRLWHPAAAIPWQNSTRSGQQGPTPSCWIDRCAGVGTGQAAIASTGRAVLLEARGDHVTQDPPL